MKWRPRFKLETGPESEPLTPAEVVSHARLGPAVSDADIDGWIKAARQQAEEFLARRLITQTWDYFWDYSWPALAFDLPYPPVQEVNEVAYRPDTSGGSLPEVVLDSGNYAVAGAGFSVAEERRIFTGDPNGFPAVFQFREGFSWPSTEHRLDAVRVRVTLGYGDEATTIPGPILRGMLLLIGHWDRHRDGFVPARDSGISGSYPALPPVVRALWNDWRSEF